MRVLIFICLLCAVLSCGGPAVRTSEQIPPEKTPAAIVTEMEIKGTVLGRAIKEPRGVASDDRGFSYVVDAGNNRVIKFDPTMKPVIDRGGYGNQEGQFNQPRFISVDNVLSVLVSDAGNRRIERLDLQLNYIDQYVLRDDDDPLKYGQPSGVATTKYGAAWIVDHDKNRLIILDNVGSFDKFAADYGANGGELDRPEKLISDDEDNFYVCDPGHLRIAVYDSYGIFHHDIKVPELTYPSSIAFDDHGFLWAMDLQTGRLFCFTKDGTNLTEKGVEIFGLSEPLSDPVDFTFLPGNKLLISDAGDDRLILCRIVYAK